MKKNIQLIQSGISLVDQTWGGFYKGGTYLMIGPHKSGRTLLGLQYALQSAKNKEVCLYFTNMRPKDLIIHAASIDFDIQSYMNQNLIVVVRVAPPTDLYDLKNPDDYLVEYLKDIVTVVGQYSPTRVIFDELTPYIGFSNIEMLRSAFLQTVEAIEEKNITSLYLLGEPATPIAQTLVDVLAQNVTANIYLKKNAQDELNNHGGKITITPNIGHTEGQFTSNYFIEPYKGIVFDYVPAWNPNNPYANLSAPGSVPGSMRITNSGAAASAGQPNLRITNSGQAQAGARQTNGALRQTRDSGYQRLSAFGAPSAEPYSFSNLYELNDFLLILNNQIALYKSTGQMFNLVSFKLDITASQRGLLTMNQLQNAVRLATDKKDKICVQGSKIIVLIPRSDSKSVQMLISKIQSNLPNTDSSYLRNIAEYISVMSVDIDETIENAESLMGRITDEETGASGIDGYNNYNSI